MAMVFLPIPRAKHKLYRRICDRCHEPFDGVKWETICEPCKPLRKAELRKERIALDREMTQVVPDGDWRDPAIFGELDRLIAEEAQRGASV